jgi:hypothetical protein
MQVTPTGAFLRKLKKLSASDREDAIVALEQFLSNPKAKSLNFEAVRNRDGYHTIRANYSVRVLLREVGRWEYEAVAVGNHDFIYVSFFRK